MPLKSRAGHIQDRFFYDLSQFRKKRFENISVYGPIKVKGRSFVAAVYYNKWTYWKWMFLHIFYLIGSFFSFRCYFKEASLAKKVKGILVFDEKENAIHDEELQKKVATVALVWVDTYLNPVFPPQLFNKVDAIMTLEEKIFEQCKNRKAKKATNLAEKMFFEELKKADKQVVEFYQLFKKYHTSLKNARSLFYQISDKPSDVNVRRLESVTKNLISNFQKLANWCDKRAKTWPDFVDSYDMFKKSEERKKGKKGFLKRMGLKFVWNRILSIIIKIVSGGNVILSEAGSLAALMGFEGVKIILSFRWQTKSLKKSAKRYNDFSKHAKKFLELYERASMNDFLR